MVSTPHGKILKIEDGGFQHYTFDPSLFLCYIID